MDTLIENIDFRQEILVDVSTVERNFILHVFLVALIKLGLLGLLVLLWGLLANG